jgi:hypothetical protein
MEFLGFLLPFFVESLSLDRNAPNTTKGVHFDPAHQLAVVRPTLHPDLRFYIQPPDLVVVTTGYADSIALFRNPLTATVRVGDEQASGGFWSSILVADVMGQLSPTASDRTAGLSIAVQFQGQGEVLVDAALHADLMIDGVEGPVCTLDGNGTGFTAFGGRVEVRFECTALGT